MRSVIGRSLAVRAGRGWRGQRLAGWLCVLAVSVGLVTPAEAFVCSRTGLNSGPSVAWSTKMVSWVAHPSVFSAYDANQARADVLAAFEAWSSTGCSDLQLVFAGEQDVQAGFRDGAVNTNAVVLLAASWPYQAGAIAVTTTTYDTQTGQLIDADIEINGEDFTFIRADASCDPETRVMDLRNTLTHEAGHFIGLEHPPSTSTYDQTTMFASAPPCETQKQTLAQDDVDGVCFIYPTGESTQPCFEIDSPSFGVVDSGDGFGGCRAAGPKSVGLWLLLLGSLGFLRCRRPSPGPRLRAR